MVDPPRRHCCEHHQPPTPPAVLVGHALESPVFSSNVYVSHWSLTGVGLLLTGWKTKMDVWRVDGLKV